MASTILVVFIIFVIDYKRKERDKKHRATFSP